MNMRTLLIGLCTAATSLILADESQAQAESLQEKIEGLWDATASVEIAPTPIGCEELQRRVAESQSYSQPFVTVDQLEVTQLLVELAECETEEPESNERPE